MWGLPVIDPQTDTCEDQMLEILDCPTFSVSYRLFMTEKELNEHSLGESASESVWSCILKKMRLLSQLFCGNFEWLENHSLWKDAVDVSS